MKTLYRNTHIALVLFTFSSFAFLSGCGASSPGKLSTATGRPEVTIANSNMQTVMDGIAAWLAVEGRTIVGTTVYTITASYPRPYSFMGFSLKATLMSDYTVVQNGADVELYEKTESNQGGDLNAQSDYEEMQKELVQIAEFIKARPNSDVVK